MPLTLAQAHDVANHKLLTFDTGGVELRIVSSSTKEFDIGWVFYYQSARYLETRNISDSLAGNAPVFISRSDGRSFTINYHRPLEESLAIYRACGDPNAQETGEVRLSGWRKGSSAVAAIQAIRQHSTMGLAQAKHIVDACLADETPTVSLSSVAEARALVIALASAGFDARVCYDR